MEQNQDQEYIEREHCLILEHRRSLKITGVTDVKQLALDKGIIEVEGCVNSLEYQEQKGQSQGESFWKRLLR